MSNTEPTQPTEPKPTRAPAPERTVVSEWPDYVAEHGDDPKPATENVVEDWAQRVERLGPDNVTAAQEGNEVDEWPAYLERHPEGVTDTDDTDAATTSRESLQTGQGGQVVTTPQPAPQPTPEPEPAPTEPEPAPPTEPKRARRNG